MADIVTSITAVPQDDGKLQVTGRTEYSDGRHEEVRTIQTKEEYETMRRIAKRLADETPKLPGNGNPDGSNLSTGMQLALIKAHGNGSGLEAFDVGSPSYEAAKKVAFDNQMQPHHELVDKLVMAMSRETAEKSTSAPASWVNRTAEPSIQQAGHVV